MKAVSCVILVIMYRLFMVTFLSGLDTFDLISDNAKLIASISSAMLNFIFIKSLNGAFSHLAVYLTNLELPRTEEQYEHSYTLKMFIFQVRNKNIPALENSLLIYNKNQNFQNNAF